LERFKRRYFAPSNYNIGAVDASAIFHPETPQALEPLASMPI
jgi:hypothetical protein